MIGDNFTFNGYALHVNDALCVKPALEVAPDFEWITPQRRHEVNAWLLERFGVKHLAFVIENSGRPTLVVSTETLRMLRQQAANKNCY